MLVTVMTCSHVAWVSNGEIKNRNFDFYEMTKYCNILKDTYPVSKFPRYYEYKSPCLRNMKTPT